MRIRTLETIPIYFQFHFGEKFGGIDARFREVDKRLN